MLSIANVVRVFVRGMGFWAMLGATIWFIHTATNIPDWWSGAFLLMLKFYYDDLKNGGGTPA